jgi:hypothetical protein
MDGAAVLAGARYREFWRGLTFEFTRPAEAGGVSPVCDDATAGTHRAYTACRSGSGVQRVVRRHASCAKPAGELAVESVCPVVAQ